MKSQLCVAAIVLLGSLGLIAFKQASLRTPLAPTVLYAAVTSLTIILTQLMALPLYGETLTPTQILGIVITVGGVVIATL